MIEKVIEVERMEHVISEESFAAIKKVAAELAKKGVQTFDKA